MLPYYIYSLVFSEKLCLYLYSSHHLPLCLLPTSFFLFVLGLFHSYQPLTDFYRSHPFFLVTQGFSSSFNNYFIFPVNVFNVIYRWLYIDILIWSLKLSVKIIKPSFLIFQFSIVMLAGKRWAGFRVYVVFLMSEFWKTEDYRTVCWNSA